MQVAFSQQKKWVNESWRALKKWREEAKQDFKYYTGDHWDKDDKQRLLESGRLPVVFNRCAVVIDSVVGQEINNRAEVRYIPRELGDALANEIMTGAAEWFRDEANAEAEDSDAFQDALICGLGWTETRIEYESDPEGAPKIERVDPLVMGWDHNATRRGLTDTRYRFRVHEMTLIEVQDMFPGISKQEAHAGWFEGVRDDGKIIERHHDDDHRHESEDEDRENETVTVIQIEYRVKQRFVMMADPNTGQKVELSEEQFKALKGQFEAVGLGVPTSRPITKWKYYKAFLGADIIENTEAPVEGNFSFQPICGKRDREQKSWYGLMRAMRDPQMWSNKFMQQTLHILNTNSQGGILAEADAFEDPNLAVEQWSRPDGVTLLKSGAIAQGKVMPKPKAEFPQAFWNLVEYSNHSLRETTGINHEFVGARDANQAGILEFQRRQSAMNILAKMFDGLRTYRLSQGRVILHYIQHYLSDGRLVRITGEGGEQYIQLVRQADAQYDVIIDDAPSSPNAKEQTWQMITQLLPVLGQMDLGADIWADIIKYSPLPATVAEKVAEKFAAMSEPDPQAQQLAQAMQQLELAGMQADVREKMANAQLDEMKAAEIGASAQVRPMEAQAGLISAMSGAQKAQADASKAQVDAMRAATEAQNAPAQSQADAFAKMAKATKDLQEASLAPAALQAKTRT